MTVRQIRDAAAHILIGTLAAYAAFWLIIEVGARTGLWYGVILGVDTRLASQSASLLQTLALFSGNTLAIAAFVALLMRSRWTLLVYLVSIVPGLFDWYFMATNPGFQGVSVGYIGLLLYLLGLVPLYAMWRAGDLRRSQE